MATRPCVQADERLHRDPHRAALRLDSSPAVYHRHDGYNVVLGKSTANHVIEHAYKRGTLWDDYDLTASTGETP